MHNLPENKKKIKTRAKFGMKIKEYFRRQAASALTLGTTLLNSLTTQLIKCNLSSTFSGSFQQS